MSRPDWSTLPASVVTGVERVLGSGVASAVSQTGGWSPGVAALVTCADGSRAFVKAASAEVNDHTPVLHRREAALTPLLPPHLGCARLLGVVDEPPWFVLVLTAVDGRPPAVPWRDGELDAALRALAELREVPAPAGVPLAVDALADELDRWPLLVGEPRLPAWEAAAAERLVEVEAGWRDAVAGDRLLHLDVRSDNLLVTPDGRAVLVDWPWAAAGDPLLDVLGFAPSVALDGGPEPGELLVRSGVPADPAAVLALGAALLGLFRWESLQPVPGGMGAIREFQAAQADVLSRWLAPLMGR